ncbi:MAG: hypothetical protein ACRC78_03060 [Planktothrix sp.]
MKQKKRNNSVWVDTLQLLERLNPDNHRDHDPEGDIPKIVESLLEFGWVQLVTVQKDGYVISGHGRIMSAHFLMRQTADWFEQKWETWLAKEGFDSQDRKLIAEEHNQRFESTYWAQCPCIETNLTEQSQITAAIRLNNTAYDGKDNPAKTAARLASIKNKELLEVAAWRPADAEGFINAFMQKKRQRIEYENQEREKEQEENTEYQDKEYFEAPDATTYKKYETDDYSNTQGYESVIVDEEVQPTRAEGVFYDDTHAILCMSKEQAVVYKKLCKEVAGRMGISTAESTKVWRPKVIFAALEYICNTIPAIEGEE